MKIIDLFVIQISMFQCITLLLFCEPFCCMTYTFNLFHEDTWTRERLHGIVTFQLHIKPSRVITFRSSLPICAGLLVTITPA